VHERTATTRRYLAVATQHRQVASGSPPPAPVPCKRANVTHVRVLMDYRPALRERSGVGEYAYQLARALLASFPPGASKRPLALTLFSSSWKDRLTRDAGLERACVIDRRVPVGLLNLAWHRLEWPSAETLAGARFDVAHSPHPLLLPSRSAAQTVTIHDLHFLSHPERSRAEVRRDYPALVRRHALRADQIVVPSRFTAVEVERRLEIRADRISVCPHGRPNWAPRAAPPSDRGYVLFVGTLEARKNVGGLLDAFERLSRRAKGGCRAQLVIAGKAPPEARPWLDRIARPPLNDVVRYLGYVDPDRRRVLYEGARVLVQPSFEEGFGFPVLEAMTLGVPVVAAKRGSLPELLGDAGILVEPDDPDQMAAAIAQMLEDDGLAVASAAKGLTRSRLFDWRDTAHRTYAAYQLAIDHRRCESA
jgi:glycosyltransferase involved in cell wall biosynthesis